MKRKNKDLFKKLDKDIKNKIAEKNKDAEKYINIVQTINETYAPLIKNNNNIQLFYNRKNALINIHNRNDFLYSIVCFLLIAFFSFLASLLIVFLYAFMNINHSASVDDVSIPFIIIEYLKSNIMSFDIKRIFFPVLLLFELLIITIYISAFKHKIILKKHHLKDFIWEYEMAILDRCLEESLQHVLFSDTEKTNNESNTSDTILKIENGNYIFVYKLIEAQKK